MRLLPIVMVACAFGIGVSEAQAGGSLKDGGDFSDSGRCVGGAFAGPYAGVHVGFGSMRSTDQAQAFIDGFPIGEIGSSDNDRGFSIGGHTGYNLQCGRVLFGIESDFNYFDADTSTGLGTTAFAGSSIDWYGTLRGRLGLISNDTFMIYATGGLAYADVDHTLYDPGAPGGTFSASSGGTQWGWTAGGGIEFMRDGNWSLRAEALYVDLGSESETFTVSDTGPCGSSVCTSRVNWDDSFWVARVGLTYHFRRDEPAPYVPLK